MHGRYTEAHRTGPTVRRHAPAKAGEVKHPATAGSAEKYSFGVITLDLAVPLGAAARAKLLLARARS